MKSALLKKIVLSGMDIIFSSRDTPQELVLALVSMMNKSLPGRYISKTIRENLQKNDNALTPKEWEVINLISQGYSLSEIASKKCRAMSTISTQKRNAMNKLHLKNESELLCFLHQNTFF
ncbi:helix-turn-helix transcriptional regulator [Serratia plymuthica]|nr:LuxR C-terminal-related transcriptional regulator [Serratia plymuthica]